MYIHEVYVWIFTLFVPTPTTAPRHDTSIRPHSPAGIFVRDQPGLRYRWPSHKICIWIFWDQAKGKIRRKERSDRESDWHHDPQVHIAKDRWLVIWKDWVGVEYRSHVITSIVRSVTWTDIIGYVLFLVQRCIDGIQVWMWILAPFHTTSTTTPHHNASTRLRCPSQILLMYSITV
jgi:hypothetical protein